MNTVPELLTGARLVVGDASILLRMPTLAALPIFDEGVIDFFHALSRELMRDSAGFADVTTFAFWCRKAALLQRKAVYANGALRLGRGIAFHSTPSNVPMNFAFSFAAGLLAGNASIIRLPGREFAQVNVVCRAMNTVLASDTHIWLAPYIVMLTYASSRALNDLFSSMCDVRVLWGGDVTIQRMRLSPLAPRAVELAFANRFSIAVIHADGYLNMMDSQKIARAFYSDTYATDQNACTAPRIIVWLGERKAEAQERFWKTLGELAQREYTLTPVQSVGKLEALCTLAARRLARRVSGAEQILVRVQVESLDVGLVDHIHNSGYFIEYNAQTLEELTSLCVSACQTLAYCGMDASEIRKLIAEHRPRGVDRIVELGHTQDFELTWDGHDLIRGMSREIVCLR